MIYPMLTKIKKFVVNNKYFFIIYGLLVLLYLTLLWKIDDVFLYNFNYYVVSYKYGFISRGLIGHIFTSIFDFVSIRKVYIILNVVFLFILMFIAYIFQALFKKQDNITLSTITTLLCIFNPASFILMITMSEFGRFDIFVFILTIISLILIYKNKYLFLIPIIVMIAIFVYQGFLLMYAPLILMIIIYNYLNEKKIQWIILLSVTILSLLFSFSTVVLYGKPSGFETSAQYEAELIKNTDIPIPRYDFNAIDAEYFRSITEHIDLAMQRLATFPREYFLIGFILLISYLYVHYILLYQFIIKKNKCLPWLVLSCFGAIIMFFIGVDFGRWYIAIINALILLFVYLIFDQADIIKINYGNIKKKYVFLTIMIIFYALTMQNQSFTFMKFTKFYEIYDKLKYFWS